MTGNVTGIIGAGIGLFLFGIIFAYITHRLGSSQQGYTWGLVVIGVAVTVAVSGLFIGSINVLTLLVFFAASGTPMIIGDIYDEISRRARMDHASNERLRDIAEWGISQAGEVKNDDPKKAAR